MRTEGRQVHLIVNRMPTKGGGLHKAVRDRANTLAEHGVGDEVEIDLLRFQPRLWHRVSRERKAGRLHHKVKVRNVLAILDDGPPKDRREKVSPPDDLSVRVVHDRDGLLQRIDHLSPSGAVLRSENVNRSGRVERVTEFGAPGEVVRERFIGRSGQAFLVAEVAPETGDWGRCEVFGHQSRTFTSGADLYRYAFERLLSSDPAPVVISENRESRPALGGDTADDLVRSLRHPGIRKVAVAHSSHLWEPYQTGSPVSPQWQRLIDGIGDLDALVVWTEGQREELTSRVAHPERIVAIPPVAPKIVEPRNPVDPDRLVLVARTERKKRVDEALRLFHAVRQCNPDARLEIFGFGYGDEEEAKIEALIDELDIRSSIHLMGFVTSRRKIYDGAAATVLTSESEGLGLAVLESLSFGVPVVSYDTNYGPRDMIIDGENGYLVPFGDHQAAAERVLSLMEDTELRARLADGARRSLTRFDLANYLDRWADVIGQSRGR